MIRFGLRMTLRGGRESLVRLVVTAAAVGLGVGLLLSVLGMYHAYSADVDRPCWECTGDLPSTAPATLLWRYRQDEYAGRTIERLDVATLSATAPAIPGLSHMPPAGDFYASPALANLLHSVPTDELGDRFPGRLAGTIGPAALSGPDELAIVIGYQPAALTAMNGTQQVSTIATEPRGLSSSTFYKFGFAMGAVALLVPMMVLIGTATRMAAARREERYAAMRLVGATYRQINVVASVEAVVGALFGAAVGIGVYALLHPLLVHLPLLGSRFFAAEITPTSWGYAGAFVAVPLAAAAACLMSLRRVGISPLGVSRRVTPAPPRIWRVIPVLAGLGLFVVPLLTNPTRERQSPGFAEISLVLVMIGLMIAGPWLTMGAARVLARFARGGSSLLAARRMADNPRAAFRSVSGLVLAVLVGTALAALVPAALASQNTSEDGALANVLLVGLGYDDVTGGPTASETAPVIGRLNAIPGAHVLPLYNAPQANQPSKGSAATPQAPRGVTPQTADLPDTVIGCDTLRVLPVLGSCAPGEQAVLTNIRSLFTDNIASLNRRLPLVTTTSKPTESNVNDLHVSVLLVVTNNSATLEKVRTSLSTNPPPVGPKNTPMTFGEVGAARATLYLEIQRIVTIVAGVTLLIAGCSLAIAVSGSLVERKRPFTLLRVTGTATRALYRAVVLETVLPLAAATVVAAGVGLLLAYPIARALAPQRHELVLPATSYYVTLGTGLAVAMAVIFACLPILGRITQTNNARFE
jgi:ABC-type antimicrobial peptide transport system permease subunit